MHVLYVDHIIEIESRVCFLFLSFTPVCLEIQLNLLCYLDLALNVDSMKSGMLLWEKL